MFKNRIILHLSLINGIGPAAIANIIDKKSDMWQWHDLYQMTAADFQGIFGFSEDKAQKLAQGLSDQSALEKELSLIERHQIRWITLFDDDYPELLKHIYVPPAVLYVKGANLTGSDLRIAVVGSRAMNWYGKKAIEMIVPPLVIAGFTIVSGGALGADSCAHKTALEHGGRTIVVVGSGLLHPYPASNKMLFEEIVRAGGSIVSSFPLDTPAQPGNFPARNRIIAGLSVGCLVVQAAEKSGAGITARFALEQGRDVFAIPGSIDDSLSAGCHKLIKEGAKLVHSAEDIIEEYVSFPLVGPKVHNQKAVAVSARKIFDPVHEQIFSHCSLPTSIDELSEKMGMSLQELNEKLFEMQLQGIVSQQMGLWHRC